MGKLTDKQKELLQSIYDNDSEIIVSWNMDKWGHKKIQVFCNQEPIPPAILKKILEDGYLKPLEQSTDRDVYILSNKAIEIVDKNCWETDKYDPNIESLINIDNLTLTSFIDSGILTED